MKTFRHLWQYLADFLEWEMFQTKVVEKIKIHILCSITFFFRKSRRLWDNVEKCEEKGRRWQNGGALHYGLVSLHIRGHTSASAYPHPHARTNARARIRTHTEISKTWLFHSLLNAPHCYVTRALPAVLLFAFAVGYVWIQALPCISCTVTTGEHYWEDGLCNLHHCIFVVLLLLNNIAIRR